LVPNELEVREHLRQTALRLTRALGERLLAAQHRYDQLDGRRPFQFPLDGILRRQQRCDEWAGRLDRAIWNRLRDGQHRLGRLAGLIEGLSPLNVLARGYSLTTREDGHTVLRDADQVVAGERIVTRLSRGSIASRVEQKLIDAQETPSS
jgi:exodeoxyribonuclease VII large subunit